jgi:hypothetical protein
MEGTAAYVAKRLATVEAPGEIFTPTAVGVIHVYGGRIPRKESGGGLADGGVRIERSSLVTIPVRS